jgi:outer membrane protein OmpA-like peptidoglycan-associated protein
LTSIRVRLMRQTISTFLFLGCLWVSIGLLGRDKPLKKNDQKNPQAVTEKIEIAKDTVSAFEERNKTFQEQVDQFERQRQIMNRMSAIRDSMLAVSRPVSPFVDDWSWIQNDLKGLNVFFDPLKNRTIIGIPMDSLFKHGSTINPNEYANLLWIYLALQKAPNSHVTIEGYDDSEGSSRDNRALSQDRANAVRDFFLLDGFFDPNRFTAIGFGDGLLNDGGNQPLNQKQKDRIDVVIQQ